MQKTSKKFLTFKDYLEILDRMKKVVVDLHDIDQMTGGELSTSDDSNDRSASSEKDRRLS